MSVCPSNEIHAGFEHILQNGKAIAGLICIFTASVCGREGHVFSLFTGEGVPQSLVKGPFPAGEGYPISGLRSFPGEREGRGGVSWGGTPVRSQVRVLPPALARTRTWVPPPWGQGLEYPCHPSSPPTVHTTDRICHGRYASCGHAGGLSCYKSAWSQNNTTETWI